MASASEAGALELDDGQYRRLVPKQGKPSYETA